MNLKTTILKVFLMLCVLSGTVKAQLITNGGFNQSTPLSNSCYGPIFGWTTTPGDDLQWESRYNNSNWWVDITSCGWGTGRWIEQTIPTTPGKVYRIGYDLGCWYAFNLMDAGASVYLNGVLYWKDHHIDFSGNSITPLKWGRFTHCFVATATSTTIRFVCESDLSVGSPPGTNPADRGSTGAGVVGLDSVTVDSTDDVLELTLSDTCVSRSNQVTIGYNTTLSGDPYWYKDSSLLSTGTSITVSEEGRYRLEIHTACGIIKIDTFIKNCCKPEIDTMQFCMQDLTTFTIDFPRNCRDCISSVDIDFGDGHTDNLPGQSGYQFDHQYTAEGTYKVFICWHNECDGITFCDSLVIDIQDCDTCKPVIDTANFCLRDYTEFDFTFPELCHDCIGSMDIYYDDGSTDHLSGMSNYHFSHQYSSPGTYEVIYCWYNRCTDRTRCDTIVVIIEECPCEPIVNIEKFCLGETTEFFIEFPEDCRDCIQQVDIDFGDGTTNVAYGPLASYSFNHAYTTPAVYPVNICWIDQCSGNSVCTTYYVEIIACPCDPEIDTAYFCLGQATEFIIDFPEECWNCIRDVMIHYGDGQHGNISATQPVYIFNHVYGSATTYTVDICWFNTCTQTHHCKQLIIVIKNCDCVPVINSNFFCLGDFTNFDIQFSGDCFDCISGTTIDYGDMTNDFNNSTQMNYHYSHQYPGVGTYPVYICWYNTCLQQNICTTLYIHIVDCNPPVEDGSILMSARKTVGNGTQLRLYPNPTTDDCIIDGIVPENQASSIMVYDLSGKMVMEQKISEGETSVNVNTAPLKPGSYIVYVTGANVYKAFKLIKQ